MEEIDKTLEDTNYILFLDDCLMHSFDYKFGHQRPQISSNDYFTALDEVYNLISKCEFNNLKIDDLLDGPVCHSGFKRLN